VRIADERNWLLFYLCWSSEFSRDELVRMIFV
jgi:hypothetical protein